MTNDFQLEFKVSSVKKAWSILHMVLEQLDVHMSPSKKPFGLFLAPSAKVNSKWTIHPNIKLKLYSF